MPRAYGAGAYGAGALRARRVYFLRAYGAIGCIFSAPTARGAYGAEIDCLSAESYKRSFLQVGRADPP